MNFSKIRTIPSKPVFCALLSNQELLEIFDNAVSIISIRTGFCKYFYFLPQVPRIFAINHQNTSKYAVVFGSNGNVAESVAFIETQTGKILKQYQLKSANQKIIHIALGTHLFFVTDATPSIVYITQQTGTQVNSFDCGQPIKCLVANTSATNFLLLRHDNHIIIVDAMNFKQTNEIPFTIGRSPSPRFRNSHLFINFSDSIITYGVFDGEVSSVNLSTGEITTVKTPHKTIPLAYEDGFVITSDGILFSTETKETVATVTNPISLRSHESIIAVICTEGIELFESSKRPVCTVSQIQPPEPFVSQQFSMESSIYFAASTAIYSFNLVQNEISKFSTFQEKIKKIVTCQACVSIVYHSQDGDKISTYATGLKKRDELGIDAICDSNNRTWILQKDNLIAFERKSLDIQEVLNIPMPPNHRFTTIFKIGKTVAVYSPKDGLAMYVKNNQLIQFHLPRNVSIIQWPALCEKDQFHICRSTTDSYETLTKDDFALGKVSITSCCWLAQTLFAVANLRVIAIRMDATYRVIDRLPNTNCSLAAALPSQLIFVTTLPSLRVISIKRPLLFVALLDIDDKHLDCLRYILSYMPSLPIDPRTVTNLSPHVAMSVFNKAPPKYVTQDTISVYTRFARFNQILSLAKSSLPTELQNIINSKDNEIQLRKLNAGNKTYQRYLNNLKHIADAASKYGQFQIAQEIYQELNDYDSLFTLFMTARNIHNLKVLAIKSNLGPAIEYFGIKAPTKEEIEHGFKLEYEPLNNLPIPTIKQPYYGQEFTLVTGEGADCVTLWPPSFDELGDFGLREYPLTGEEAEQEIQSDIGLTSPVDVGMSNDQEAVPATNIQYKERPQEDEHKEDEDLKLDKFFDDDDDEPDQKKINIEMDFNKSSSSRKGAARNFSLNGDPNALDHLNNPSSGIPPLPHHTSRRTTLKTRKFNFDIPGLDPMNTLPNEAPVRPAPQPDNLIDLSNTFKSEEVTMHYVSEGTPNPPFPQPAPHNNLPVNADPFQPQDNSNANGTAQINVADQFTSNVFMDLT